MQNNYHRRLILEFSDWFIKLESGEYYRAGCILCGDSYQEYTLKYDYFGNNV